MNQQSHIIIEALESVLTWGLPDEELADAINDQARLMAGMNPDEPWEDHPDML